MCGPATRLLSSGKRVGEHVKERVKEHLVPFDLRFPCRDAEYCFRKDLEEDLVRTSCIGSVIYVVGLVYAVIPMYMSAVNDENYPFQWTHGDPRTQYFSIRILHLICVGTISVTSLLRWLLGRLKDWNWEYMVVGLPSCVLASTSFCIPWHVATLWNRDPAYVWGEDVRGTELLNCLVLDACLTAMSLFLPIRSCILWVVFVSALLPFVVIVHVNGSAFPTDAGNSIFTLSGLALLAFLGARRAEQSLREKWKAQRQVAQQQEELDLRYTAVSRILDRFCDCVVLLGPPPDFQILEPNPRLAALLLYTDGRNLVGSSILNYMASAEDSSRMVSALQGDSSQFRDGDLSGGVINVRFRDTQGREFAVTVSHTCIRSFEEKTRFIIGIAEPQERTHISGIVSALPRTTDAVEDPFNMFVQFSAMSFKILECCDAFVRFCRPCAPGASFEEFLPKERNHSFFSDYTRRVNEFIKALNEDEAAFNCKWVLRNQWSELRADVAITLSRTEMSMSSSDSGIPDSEDDHGIKAHAVLANIRQQDRTRTRSRSSGRSSRSSSSGSGHAPLGTRGDLVATTIGQGRSVVAM